MALGLGGLPACGGAQAAAPPPPPPAPATAATVPLDAGSPEAAPAPPEAGAPEAAAPPSAECPDGMIHVKKDFCTKVERTCLESSYDKPNHLHICHKFKQAPPKCVGDHVQLDFCIDRYEYPDKKGARPPLMVDWYTAAGEFRRRRGSLLLRGRVDRGLPERPDGSTPFPAGYKRSSDICNIDNRSHRAKPLESLLEQSGNPQSRAEASGRERAKRRQAEVRQRLRRVRHDRQFRRVDPRRSRPALRARRVRRAEGRSLGPRAQRLPPRHDQPLPDLHLLFRQLPLLQGPGGHAAVPARRRSSIR